MKFLLLSLVFTTQLFAGTRLILVGGGHRPQEAMNKFVDLSGGKASHILVIPWASNTIEGAQNIQKELSLAGAGFSEIADTEKIHEQLKKVSGIFFTGGDQNKLMKVIKDLHLKPVLKEIYQQGITFAGTSAGTAIMSESMLTGVADLSVLDGTKVERAEGLGLLPPNILVDQHFTVRGRFNRLAGAILSSPAELGIGIDENNALIITDNKLAQIVGPTEVLFIQGITNKKLTIDILSNGETYDLNLRKAVP